MNGQLPVLRLVKSDGTEPQTFEPTPADMTRLSDLAGFIALQEPQFLRALVRMGREAEHIGYLRGMGDCGRIREQAKALETPIPDDPGRTAPPGELPGDEPCQDESGCAVSGGGIAP